MQAQDDQAQATQVSVLRHRSASARRRRRVAVAAVSHPPLPLLTGLLQTVAHFMMRCNICSWPAATSTCGMRTCCHTRNVVVDRQDTNSLIESTSWCLSNRHVGVDRIAFNSNDHLQVLDRCLKGEQKQLLATAPSLIRSIFDVESTYVFLIISSHCQYFLRFLPSRPVNNHAGSALYLQAGGMANGRATRMAGLDG